jgi:hypothetical protein
LLSNADLLHALSFLSLQQRLLPSKFLGDTRTLFLSRCLNRNTSGLFKSLLLLNKSLGLTSLLFLLTQLLFFGHKFGDQLFTLLLTSLFNSKTSELLALAEQILLELLFSLD